MGHVRGWADVDLCAAPRRQVLRRDAAHVQRRQGLAGSSARWPENCLERQLQGHQGNPDTRPGDRQDHPDHTPRAVTVGTGDVSRLDHAGSHGDRDGRQGLRRHKELGVEGHGRVLHRKLEEG